MIKIIGDIFGFRIMFLERTWIPLVNLLENKTMPPYSAWRIIWLNDYG
jgi:hypothetical protein